jgi:hypothetical protein
MIRVIAYRTVKYCRISQINGHICPCIRVGRNIEMGGIDGRAEVFLFLLLKPVIDIFDQKGLKP